MDARLVARDDAPSAERPSSLGVVRNESRGWARLSPPLPGDACAHTRVSRSCAERRARGDRAREPTACLAGSKGAKHASYLSLAERETWKEPARVVVYSPPRISVLARSLKRRKLARALSRNDRRLLSASSAHEGRAPSRRSHSLLTTSEQARSPAEFKHIIKRRKRN